MTDDELDALFKACFPELPVSDRLRNNLEKLIDRIEKGELYQEDAEPGSSGQQAEER